MWKLILVAVYFIGLKCDELDDLKQLVVKLENKIQNIEVSLNNCGDQWISYSDTKCFRVLDTKGSVVEAKQKCMQLDSTSTLITIESSDEQHFIDTIFQWFIGKENYVWLGEEAVNNWWKRIDANVLEYTNWNDNPINDKDMKCVQMSLMGPNFGKLSYDLCDKKYLVACQKMQASRTVLEKRITKLEQHFNK